MEPDLMQPSDLDTPPIRAVLFHPRRAAQGVSRFADAHDGTIPAADGVALGYRLFVRAPGGPVIALFHGNGEIAAAYDGVARLFLETGASLLVADYRGYGWSGGAPRAAHLLPDAEAVYAHLPDILAPHGLADSPRFVMGRSLGSAPAIHLAHEHPAGFTGLIVDSGFAHTLPLLARLGLPVERLAGGVDPFDNAGKMAAVDLPLLVIHGEDDRLIPVGDGQALYDASPAVDRTIVRAPGAGHNNLMAVARYRYFEALADFVEAHGG
jgi:alpha-beta hydrolase superfamily lysophospholipase